MAGASGIGSTAPSAGPAPVPGVRDYPFDTLADYVHKQLRESLGNNPREPLFATEGSEGLFEIFLAGVPADVRQNHTCRCCANFVNRYGGLVRVLGDGRTRSVFWDPENAPMFYENAVAALKMRVESSRIIGLHVTDEKVWGQPQTGPWRHLSVTVPERASTHPLSTPYQLEAKAREDRKNLGIGLDRYDADLVGRALHLLKSGELPGSDKALGHAQFLANLHGELAGRRGPARDALIWLAVAGAPDGWASPQSRILGELLDGLKEGRSIGQLRSLFGIMTDPLTRMRSQSAPTEGNIAQAEKIFEKMGLAPALRRRPALLSEIPLVWSPRPQQESEGGGTFGHLRREQKSRGRVSLAPGQRAVPISWTKFARDVLPEACHIQAKMDYIKRAFAAVTTATIADAPPILQWDRPERRNPFSSYIYDKGSYASSWSLPNSGMVDVLGICHHPAMWYGGEFPHHGKSAILVLAGARDTTNQELALFPSQIRSELHSVRSTIEAHSKSGRLDPVPDGVQVAAGLTVGLGTPDVVAVASLHGTTLYAIDRWE